MNGKPNAFSIIMSVLGVVAFGILIYALVNNHDDVRPIPTGTHNTILEDDKKAKTEHLLAICRDVLTLPESQLTAEENSMKPCV
ncbi:MAG TPA: hypothetical protein VGN17_00325 [Bryobacteraceae bacterium]|jgi:hypothetical protein